MAKVFFKYNGTSDPVELSDWTLFTIGDFVGSAFYIRPENYETQLLKADFNVDWDTCFPGKFYRIANSYTGNKQRGSTFFLCFDDTYSQEKSIQTSTLSMQSPFIVSLESNLTFGNDNTYNYIYCENRRATQHTPSDYNFAWIFSDIPYYNTVFTSFDEIAEYNRSNPYLSTRNAYTIYKDDNDPDWYYGYYSCMYWPTTYIDPPNTLQNFSSHIAQLVNSSPVQADTDPYVDGGGSSTGGQGGGGAFDDSTEVVQPATLNLPNTTDILKMYLLDNNALASLGSAICTHSYADWQSYLPMFSNPLEALISLHWLPVNFPGQSTIGSITIGNYSTNIVTDVITNQFFEYDCGSIHISEYWGNYLDYDATRIQLYLPYISCISLSPDEVMNNDLHIKYTIDALTGACVATVYTYNKTILYTGSGNMAVELPLSAVTYSNLAQNTLSASISVAATAITMSAAEAASPAVDAALATTSLAGASSIMSSKPNFSKAGYIGGTCGAMSYQTPYLLISRVAQCVPQNNNEYSGYPLYVTKQLSNCSGFTQVDNIHLINMQATDKEKQEIISLLNEGVII